ncbi:hypothetical protein, partial [Sediminicurvatus halobius]|uniref:hypothetical protein n=1 Tax=Sediminicurvatus halobius TaxID=2182432 RepID=UPI001E54C24A
CALAALASLDVTRPRRRAAALRARSSGTQSEKELAKRDTGWPPNGCAAHRQPPADADMMQ